MRGIIALAITAAVLVSWAVLSAQADDQQRLKDEACGLVSQQRNSLSDAIAIAEAHRKMDAEEMAKGKQRIEQWEAYFRAYVGDGK